MWRFSFLLIPLLFFVSIATHAYAGGPYTCDAEGSITGEPNGGTYKGPEYCAGRGGCASQKGTCGDSQVCDDHYADAQGNPCIDVSSSQIRCTCANDGFSFYCTTDGSTPTSSHNDFTRKCDSGMVCSYSAVQTGTSWPCTTDVNQAATIPTGSVVDPCPNGICDTSLGPIGVTDPGAFVAKIFQVMLGISGGVALLLIIIGGYQLSLSQGNPEKVKAARERLTSAVIGLVFIIFSVAILQIVGVDILGLPGFKK